MIDVALPEEVTALRAVFEDATNEVERVGILDESFSLAAVAGIDITLPGLTLDDGERRRRPRGRHGHRGHCQRDVRSDGVPARVGRPRGVGRRAGGQRAVATAVGATDPSVMLATVARDGRWYVSLGFTVAEYARVAAGADVPAADHDRAGRAATRQRPRR